MTTVRSSGVSRPTIPAQASTVECTPDPCVKYSTGLAGAPSARQCAGRGLETTECAPTTVRSPMSAKIVHLANTITSLPIESGEKSYPWSRTDSEASRKRWRPSASNVDCPKVHRRPMLMEVEHCTSAVEVNVQASPMVTWPSPEISQQNRAGSPLLPRQSEIGRAHV